MKYLSKVGLKMKKVPILAKNSNSISGMWEGTGDATAYISERFFCSLGLKSKGTFVAHER